MKPTHYWCDLWKMNFYFYLGWKPEEFKKYTTFDGVSFEGVDGRMIWPKGPATQLIHIWIRKKTDMVSLVHECVHAAILTLDVRGVKLDADNDEPLAYLIEMIFSKARSLKK